MGLIAIRTIIQITGVARMIFAAETVGIMKVKIVVSEDKAAGVAKVTDGNQKEIRADHLMEVIGTPVITVAGQTAAIPGMMVAIRSIIHQMNRMLNATRYIRIAEIAKMNIVREVMAMKQGSLAVLQERMMKACANC